MVRVQNNRASTRARTTASAPAAEGDRLGSRRRQCDLNAVVKAIRTGQTTVDPRWIAGDRTGACATLADRQGLIWRRIEGRSYSLSRTHGHSADARTRTACSTPAIEGRGGGGQSRQRDDCVVGKVIRTSRTTVDPIWTTCDSSNACATLADRQDLIWRRIEGCSYSLS